MKQTRKYLVGFAPGIADLFQCLQQSEDPADAAVVARQYIELNVAHDSDQPAGKLYDRHWEFQLERHETVTPLITGVGRGELGAALEDFARRVVWLAKQPRKAHRNTALEACKRFFELAGVDLPEVPPEIVAEFDSTEGKMVFFSDRVELCGVEICDNSRRLERRRKALDLLRVQRKDGQFESYSCKKLADMIGIKNGATGAASLIRQTRRRISEVLRNKANIDCGDQDVIVSTDHGYRFSEKLTFQFDDQPKQGNGSDPTCSNVRNDPASDVPNVRDGDVPDVRNPDVPDDSPGSRRKWILQRIDEGHELQAPAVAKQFKCSKKTAQRDLKALVGEGEIEYFGPARTGHYRRPKPPELEQ